MKQETQILREEAPDVQPAVNVTLEQRAQLYIDNGLYQKAVEIFDVANVRALEGIIDSIHLKLSFGEAERLIRTALTVYPKNASMRSNLGWLYYSDEKYQEAFDNFEQASQSDQNYAPAIHGKLATLRMLRRFREAHTFVRNVSKRFPGHEGIQFELGWLYFDQKHYDAACQVFEEVYQKGNWSALKWIISALRAQRRFPEAENWIRTAETVLLPNDIEILNEKGWFHYDQKQYGRAGDMFSRALAVDERHEFALQGKIATLRRQRKFQEAEAALKQALSWHEKSTGILSELGWLLLDQGQHSRAAGSFEDAVKLVPARINLRFRQIEALVAMNRGYQALEILKELKRTYPGDIEVMERLGRFYLRRNDLKNAEPEFREILSLDKKNVLGMNGIAAVCFSKGQYTEAADTLLEIVKTDPKNPIWYTNLARALVRQEQASKPRRRPLEALQFWEPAQKRSVVTDLDQAEEYCKRALELDSKSADAHGCLGIIEFKRGNAHEAEELLLTSIDLDSEKGSYRDIGALYVVTKRHDEAEAMLNKALEHNKDDAPARLELGYLYLQTEKFDKALQEFHQAMMIDPNTDEAPIGVATVLMKKQSYDEAEAVLRRALGTLDKSRHWKMHLSLSRLLIQKGEETEDSNFYDEALIEARLARRLKPDHSEPYYHIGVILAKQKDYRGALKNFRLCLSKNSQHDQAERNISRIRSQIRRERTGSHFWGGFCVGVLSLSQLILLWYFFSQNKVTATILSVLIPVLLGLVVVGFLMPVLIRFKVAGLEVGFSEQNQPLYQGPKGGIGFTFAPTTISSGPR